MNELVKRIRKYPRGSEEMFSSAEYNEDVRRAWTPIWVRNSHRSYQEVERRFQNGNFDIAALREKLGGEPCLILGSGPSLEDVKPYLKDWKGKIFCSTSHLPMLAYYGLEADFCTLIDADQNMIFLVKEYVKPGSKTILFTHPQVPREILQAWPEDKVYFFRMFDPSDPFSKDYLPLGYGWVNEQTSWSIGSTILNGGNVVNAMIPLAQSYGFSPIFLCGYDLGYPGNLRRCGDYRFWPEGSVKCSKCGAKFREKPAEHLGPVDMTALHMGRPKCDGVFLPIEEGWEVTPPPPVTEQRWVEARKIVSNNGIPFDELGSFYKTSSIILWGMSSPPIISCSRGVMTEWPYADPRDVIEKQGRGFEHLIISPKDAYDAARVYLKKRGFLIMKNDFWASVQNMKSMKWPEKLKCLIEWYWFNNKPWKMFGGKGYLPLRIKRNKKKAEREAAKRAKKAKEGFSVPR